MRLLTRNTILIIVGVLLLAVAVLVNGLVNEQQLMNLPTMKDTMAQLCIDQTVFTLARSALIGLMGVLLAIVGRMGTVQGDTKNKTTGARHKASIEDKAQEAMLLEITAPDKVTLVDKTTVEDKVTIEAERPTERRLSNKEAARVQASSF